MWRDCLLSPEWFWYRLLVMLLRLLVLRPLWRYCRTQWHDYLLTERVEWVAVSPTWPPQCCPSNRSLLHLRWQDLFLTLTLTPILILIRIR